MLLKTMPKPVHFIRHSIIKIKNWFRSRREICPYIYIDLNGEITDFPPPPPPIPSILAKRFMRQEAIHVAGLKRVFEQIAADDRIEGVILKIECVASGAIYQSLRGLMPILRNRGKKVIAYANSFSPFQYYLACACDKIIMPPSAEWAVLGMHQEYVFLKDALNQLGIQFEVINVSPFKSAGDQLTRTDFSEESRAQAEWLLNAFFNELVSGIAMGRKIAVSEVITMIDAGPYSAKDAISHGLIDAALYEDELENYLLGVPKKSEESHLPKLLQRYIAWQKTRNPNAIAELHDLEKAQKSSLRIMMLDEALNVLRIPIIEYANKFIGIVGIEGVITDGKSQNAPVPLPILGSKIAGALSVSQALRQAETDDKIAGVLLYVNSGGGSALGSDLMAREVYRLQQKKPVVVYMSSVAASGGYYVSALAKHIVAQPLTVTGSIGVVILKPNTLGADQKLQIHRNILQRGARAGMLNTSRPFSSDERQAVSDAMMRVYDDFKAVVAQGRQLDKTTLESICGGRVWTGEMAKEHRLVDTLGGVSEAFAQLRLLSGLQPEVDAGKRVGAIMIHPPKKWLLPQPFQMSSFNWVIDAYQFWKKKLAQTQTWLILPFSNDDAL
jgi:protease-4